MYSIEEGKRAREEWVREMLLPAYGNDFRTLEECTKKYSLHLAARDIPKMQELVRIGTNALYMSRFEQEWQKESLDAKIRELKAEIRETCRMVAEKA